MDIITLEKCDDGSIRVTSNENQFGTKSTFNKITDINEQMLIALSKFLDYEPVEFLNLDNIEFDMEDKWLRFRRQTIKRMYKIRRVNNLKRMHFLEPLIKVIKSGEIDQFISILRKNNHHEAILKIMQTFNLTDYQAEQLISSRISDLCTNKLPEYEAELVELMEEDIYLSEIICSDKEMNKLIISQLKEGIE